MCVFMEKKKDKDIKHMGSFLEVLVFMHDKCVCAYVQKYHEIVEYKDREISLF